ncbi:MAG: glycine cleavage system aminomethyltransferase GcvT [Pseudomonadota bacterium]
MGDLKRTGLYELHAELGAKFVPFAGYEMPVQYTLGVMKEHLHTRVGAGLFDVSHMGQIILRPRSGDLAEAARALEALVPADLLGLAPGRQRYGVFTNEAGGIEDDLMIANRGDHLFLVVNAARKAADLAHLAAHLAETCVVEEITDRALIALQGPAAEAALAPQVPEVAGLRFMDVAVARDLWISRSGYTGEDGFEISLPAARAEAFVRRLLAHTDVAPVGLGARDSLRLEAGLCLYGADLDETTSPVEAGLTWAIGKARRAGGPSTGGFPGATRILGEIATGAPRARVGLRPETRAPMRAGTRIFCETSETEVGYVTSGAFGPTLDAPISMAYVTAPHSAIGTVLYGEVRGKRLPARICPLPFTPANFKR